MGVIFSAEFSSSQITPACVNLTQKLTSITLLSYRDSALCLGSFQFSLFKKGCNLSYIYSYVWVYVYVGLSVSASANGGQKKVLDFLELDSQKVVKHLTFTLATKLGFPGKAASTPTH